MVIALHAGRVAQCLSDERTFNERDLVRSPKTPGSGRCRSCPTTSGRCCSRRPASVHRHDLQATTDAQHRQVACQGTVKQRELTGVAIGPPANSLCMRLLAVELRVQVGAASENQTVERSRASAGRRRTTAGSPRQAAGRVHLVDVAAGIRTAGWSHTPQRACSR